MCCGNCLTMHRWHRLRPDHHHQRGEWHDRARNFIGVEPPNTTRLSVTQPIRDEYLFKSFALTQYLRSCHAPLLGQFNRGRSPAAAHQHLPPVLQQLAQLRGIGRHAVLHIGAILDSRESSMQASQAVVGQIGVEFLLAKKIGCRVAPAPAHR